LEEKARGFLASTKEEGENIMKVYEEIWVNFFKIVGELEAPRPTYFPQLRERFKRLMKRTGDYSYIEELLDQLEKITTQVEESLIKEFPSIQLYTINLKMDTQHLHALIEVVDIPAAYLLLRNLLENVIKLLIYFKVGKTANVDDTLYLMFLYEYEASREARVGSLSEFKNKWKKFLKIYSELSSNDELKEKRVPILRVSPQVLRELSEEYDLSEANLDRIYSACSFIIHNQPPLPFFSLFEVKFFKLFLKEYVQSFKMVAEKLISKKIELREVHIPISKDLSQKSLRVAYQLEAKYDKEIKRSVKKALETIQKEQNWIDPLTLTSIFYILSPSFKHLRSLSFVEEDVEEIIKEIEPYSYKVSIQNETYETLNALQEVLLQDLEKYENFSSLESEKQKRKVIFYLLLHYLPEITKEALKRL
jgi:hypothetical protein